MLIMCTDYKHVPILDTEIFLCETQEEFCMHFSELDTDFFRQSWRVNHNIFFSATIFLVSLFGLASSCPHMVVVSECGQWTEAT